MVRIKATLTSNLCLIFDSLGFFRYAIYRNRREMTVQVIRAAHQVNANIRAIDASAPYKAVHLL